MNKGLIIGLALFVLGLGVAIFLGIFLQDTPGMFTASGMGYLAAAVIGFPACVIVTVIGMVLSSISAKDLNIRKNVGWFFFGSGAFLVVYCLQWLIPEVVDWWNPSARDHSDLVSAIVVVCVISLVIPGIIMFVGWRFSHPRKIVRNASQTSDEPDEEP